MIVVQKFGGTCLATPQNRELACERIRDAMQGGFNVCAVVSAMGRRGEPYATDTLISLAKGVQEDIAAREMDLLSSCGEIISAVLMVQELRRRGIPAMALSGGQAGIVTDSKFGDANILKIDPAHLRRHLEEGSVVAVAGFQGHTESGDITTLGRGGSDTTATALGAALDAAYVEIYTDVEGIMTADPRIVQSAKTIPVASYEEVTQMAWEGAKVIHPRAVEIAHRARIPVWVRGLRKDSRKTLLTGGEKQESPWLAPAGAKPVTGVTYINDLVQIVVGRPQDGDSGSESFPRSVFDALRDVSLDLINVFPDRVSFVIPESNLMDAVPRLERLRLPMEVLDKRAKVTVVGYGMHNLPGVMDTVIGALAKEKIRVLASADSNITIACLIEQGSLQAAVNALHSAFRLS